MLMQLEKSHLAASNWYKVALKLLHDQWDLGMELQRERKKYFTVHFLRPSEKRLPKFNFVCDIKLVLFIFIFL